MISSLRFLLTYRQLVKVRSIELAFVWFRVVQVSVIGVVVYRLQME